MNTHHNINFVCPKCRNTQCEIDQMRATGGVLAKLFDVQNKKFTSVTCSRCRYTEFYKTDSTTIGNIFDFFTN